MADNTKSQGSFGLPHYKNSRAAMDLFEPVYKNYYTIQISMPVGVGSSPENTNLLLENVQKISGLESNSFPTSQVEQKYKWASRRFAGGKPENMIDKIMQGKLQKFYEGVCLENQKFIKDDKKTIIQVINEASKETGLNIKIKQFTRFAVGK